MSPVYPVGAVVRNLDTSHSGYFARRGEVTGHFRMEDDPEPFAYAVTFADGKTWTILARFLRHDAWEDPATWDDSTDSLAVWEASSPQPIARIRRAAPPPPPVPLCDCGHAQGGHEEGPGRGCRTYACLCLSPTGKPAPRLRLAAFPGVVAVPPTAPARRRWRFPWVASA